MLQSKFSTGTTMSHSVCHYKINDLKYWVGGWWAQVSKVTLPRATCHNYTVFKCPGVYFLATSVEGAFKRDGSGRLLVMSTPNSCTAAVIVLFLAAATALSFNLKSYEWCFSLCVLSAISIYLFYAAIVSAGSTS